jgi:bifunctional DNase/RNase
MVEMVIDSIRVSLMNYQRVVILKERDSDRYLPIWIGSPEADAIAVKLQDVAVPRPLTHDLLGSVIAELGAVVDHVIVSDLSDDTFFAKLVLNVKDGPQREVDCRPSDAIALAVRGGQLVNSPDGEERWFATVQEAQKFLDEVVLDKEGHRFQVRLKVPIYVEDGVIEKAGITMEGDIITPTADRIKPSGPGSSRTPKPVTEDEMKKLSAFSEFLADLPGLEDLGSSSGSGS